MKNSNRNKGTRDVRRAAFIKDSAEIVGVSTNEAQKVLRGDRNNDTVVMVFQEIKDRYKLLLDEVKQLVPFN